jgi:hypothetical protein
MRRVGDAILGYARVSTLTALSAAGVATDRIFTDKLSGSAKTARLGLAAMLDYARRRRYRRRHCHRRSWSVSR